METPIATNLCEVMEITDDNVSIQLLGEQGYLVQLKYPLKDVPEPARLVGGTFYIDTYNKGNNGCPKYVSIARAVDTSDEMNSLGALYSHVHD